MLKLPDGITACLFDLDGVITQPAKLHSAAWKEMFDTFLRERSEQTGEPFEEFTPSDYDRCVDGRPRLDGVRTFLEARGIEPDEELVRRLGDIKNDLVLKLIRERGVEVYDGSIDFVKEAQREGLRRAVVSSSANTREVLKSVGIEDLFEAVVDGLVAQREGLPGKPAPDPFIAGARRGLRGRPRRRGGRAGRRVRLRGGSRPHRTAASAGRTRRGHRRGRSQRADRAMSEELYDVETWAVRERELRLDRLGPSESVFALSNGHIGLRGNLDEGEPVDTPGTYLNAFYEVRPLPYAETAYGLPDSGQTLVNVTNGKVIRLLVDDEPFDIRYGDLLRHERVLDLRDGVLRREVYWRSPTGREVRVRSTRLVSFVHRSVAAIAYDVEPVDATTRIVLQSELVANEPVPAQADDPRAAAALKKPLECEQYGHHELRAGMVHRTKVSGLRMAAGMDHIVEGPEGTTTATESEPDLARVTITTELEPGQELRVVKFLAYGWSSRRSRPSLRDQVDAALASAQRT